MITAVVYHPGKARTGRIRRLIETTAARRGWRTLWLPTTPEDAGAGATRTALDAGAQMVFTAGGDGTVRTVCGELAGTDVPVALLPAGTGNLLVRNLGLPMTMARAALRAFAGTAHPIDLIRFHSDAGSGHAAAMAGVGSDAAVLRDTSERLKGLIGPAAYVVAGLRHIAPVPVPTMVRVDGGEPERHFSSLAEVGNVGSIHRGVRLLPAADASDGLLDVLIASPLGSLGALRLAGTVLLRTREGRRMRRHQARRVEIELETPRPFQVDGDVLGDVTRVEFEVLPRAVSVML